MKLKARFTSLHEYILNAFIKRHGLPCMEQVVLTQSGNYYNCISPRPLADSFESEDAVYTVCRISQIERPNGNDKFVRVHAYDYQATPFTFNMSANAVYAADVESALQKHSNLYIHGQVKNSKYGIKLNSVAVIPPALRGKITPKLKAIPNTASGWEVTLAFCSLTQDLAEQGIPLIAPKIRSLFAISETLFASILNKYGFVDVYALITALLERSNPNKYKAALLCVRTINVKDYLQRQQDLSDQQRGASYSPALKLRNSSIEQVVKQVRMQGIQLTPSQLNAVKAISLSQRESTHGNALLSGDVGTGKSLVIAIVAAAAQMDGMSCAIMAPTPRIVLQLTEQIALFGGRNIETRTGDNVKQQYLGDGSGVPRIIVGTTALLHDESINKLQPDLFIVDEEQGFGINQKYKLVKANTYHLLSTATAIPATMQMAMSGRRDTITLHDRHVERDVATQIHGKDSINDLFAAVSDTLKSGKQVVIITPLTDRAKSNAYHDALKISEIQSQWESAFRGKTIAIHGDLNSAEKAEKIEQAVNGDYPIIIATSAIETGLNAKHLTHMIVLEPARFGLRQLHQLRGRIGRYGDASRFDLLPITPLSEAAKQRLNLLAEIDDGFILAEKELHMRGFGALNYGDYEQSGDPHHLVPGMPITPSHVKMYGNHH